MCCCKSPFFAHNIAKPLHIYTSLTTALLLFLCFYDFFDSVSSFLFLIHTTIISYCYPFTIWFIIDHFYLIIIIHLCLLIIKLPLSRYYSTISHYSFQYSILPFTFLIECLSVLILHPLRLRSIIPLFNLFMLECLPVHSTHNDHYLPFTRSPLDFPFTVSQSNSLRGYYTSPSFLICIDHPQKE